MYVIRMNQRMKCDLTCTIKAELINQSINHYMSLGRCHTCDSIIHYRNTLIEESKCGRFEKHVPGNRCRIFGQRNCERSYFRGDDETFVFLSGLLREMMNICIRCLYITHFHEDQTRT